MGEFFSRLVNIYFDYVLLGQSPLLENCLGKSLDPKVLLAVNPRHPKGVL